MNPNSFFLATLALTLGACAANVDAPVGARTEAVINGAVDATGAYGAVATFTDRNCSAVLVAPRVMLTSAHCVRQQSLQCSTMLPSVSFAEAGGGWASTISYDARTRDIQRILARPEIIDLSSCGSSQTYNCSNPLREAIDHSKELVVLYLTADAPSDVTPLPMMVHPGVSTTNVAGQFGKLAGLDSWVNTNEPLITSVGYGVGSTAYNLGGNMVRGRDFGVQRWIAAESDYTGVLGANGCDALHPPSPRPAVRTSPDDLTWAMTGTDLGAVMPGQNFEANQIQCGGGDSGGPALFGPGPAANGISPAGLPAGGGYDPTRNYIVGTASLWQGNGDSPGCVFTPTWTLGASLFLVDALRDSDGDGDADAVDDDIDGDGCDNDVDDDPTDPTVREGVEHRINCNPSSVTTYAHGSADPDGDNVPACMDDDDDNDGVPDGQDPCPLDKLDFCHTFGRTCPWNPIFFDCHLAGCLETFLKIEWLINPADQLRVPILDAAEPGRILIGAAEGMTLNETAHFLMGGEAREQLVRLQGVAPDGEEATVALAHSGRVDIDLGGLRATNAIQLEIAEHGQSFIGYGVDVERARGARR